jgi:hypothetical protein
MGREWNGLAKSQTFCFTPRKRYVYAGYLSILTVVTKTAVFSYIVILLLFFLFFSLCTERDRAMMYILLYRECMVHGTS